MRVREGFFSLLLALPLLAALSVPALADRDHDRHDRDRRHYDFHGRDYHRFNDFELRLWTGGFWRHEWHDGRYGWWWVTDGYWYWYPQPTYPYPTYVAPPVVVAAPPPPPPAPPPAPPVIIQAPPPAPAPAAGQPPTQFWYYCEASKSYYPYVQDCAGPWHAVPVTPAGTKP